MGGMSCYQGRSSGVELGGRAPDVGQRPRGHVGSPVGGDEHGPPRLRHLADVGGQPAGKLVTDVGVGDARALSSGRILAGVVGEGHERDRQPTDVDRRWSTSGLYVLARAGDAGGTPLTTVAGRE